ncbi:MAG: hypothetical protein F6J86_32440 [Symploca sp. SIO1B1]|nr:hypothetical protein [Symploca sp. SIO1B1]
MVQQAPKKLKRFAFRNCAGGTPADKKEILRQALQVAVALEFSTIPPYLVALYSLKDKTSSAYQIIRSVALEEMLHINLACNLMNAIADPKDEEGTRPKFHGEVHIDKLVVDSDDKTLNLPIAYPDEESLRPILNGPRVQLMAASTELMRQTFMGIEQPLPETNDKLGDEKEFDSIGQFYQAIEQLFIDICEGDACPNQDTLFTGDPNWQRTDFYFGSGGGKPIKVTDLETAQEAIKQIMQQGEGAIPPNTGYDKSQPYGTYNQYGLRSDGTYGPILGTPYELSHYFKFKAIADGIVPLPSVYPMIPSPSQEKFESAGNEDAKKLNDIFNHSYSLLIYTLQEIFSGDKEEGEEKYFSTVVHLMQIVLPSFATQLMKMPMYPDGDATLGPTAGPSFEYKEKPGNGYLAAIGEAINHALISSLSSSTKATLEVVKKAICDIVEFQEAS